MLRSVNEMTGYRPLLRTSPGRPVNAEYEKHLFDYYGQPVERFIDKDAQQKIVTPFN